MIYFNRRNSASLINLN